MQNLPPFTRHETPAGVSYEILSSKGMVYYTVSLLNGKATGCECTGAAFRPTCKHQTEAEKQEQLYQKDHHPVTHSDHEQRLNVPLNGNHAFSLMR